MKKDKNNTVMSNESVTINLHDTESSPTIEMVLTFRVVDTDSDSKKFGRTHLTSVCGDFLENINEIATDRDFIILDGKATAKYIK